MILWVCNVSYKQIQRHRKRVVMAKGLGKGSGRACWVWCAGNALKLVGRVVQLFNSL